MILRRFNELGMDKFQEFLDRMQQESGESVPRFLLEDDEYSELITPVVRVDPGPYTNHFEISKHLHERFRDSSGLTNIERDGGLWAWLSLLYFDQLCPRKVNGSRSPGERARWILNTSSRRYYRQLIAGPYLVYRLHADSPERAIAMLCNPINELSDVYLELVDNPKLISAPTVVEAVTRLYYDPDTGRLKKGTARDAKGGARRFGEILEQFNCTWDFHSLPVEQILAFLPAEFDRFKCTK